MEEKKEVEEEMFPAGTQARSAVLAWERFINWDNDPDFGEDEK